MRRASALRILAHGIATITLGGVVVQVVLAALTEPKNLLWGFGILLLTFTALLAGWLIALRRPENPLGWLVLAIPFDLALQAYAALFGHFSRETNPTAASWFDWFGGDNEWSWLPPVLLLFTQIPLRFPDGRLPSPRWRWFSRFTIIVIAIASVANMTLGDTVGTHVPNPTYVDWESATNLVGTGSILIVLPAMIGSLASLFVRYRHRGAVERAQLRWVFWAVAVVAGCLVLGAFENAILGGTESPGITGIIAQAVILFSSLTYSLIPLAILFAVLRRGLYSIDRIISRTAAYAIVTLSMVALYSAIVLLGSALLPHLASVGVALATLAAAAIFLPLLRIVRRAVDRRFNRAQYDAEKVVDAFGERIRTGADPHGAGIDLLGAVESTLQPAAVGLWTAEPLR